MKRRHILTAAAALATGAGTLSVLGKNKQGSQISRSNDLGTPALGKNLKQLRLVTSWPKDFPGLGVMANRFAQYVNTICPSVDVWGLSIYRGIT